jgi:hypothetical protein
MARVLGAAALLLAIGAGVAPACGTSTTTAISGSPSAPPTAPTQGTSGACVTHERFQALHKGMRRYQVEHALGDTTSRLAAGGAGGYVRSYAACDGRHAAWVEYEVIWHGRTVVGARFNGFKRWRMAG